VDADDQAIEPAILGADAAESVQTGRPANEAENRIAVVIDTAEDVPDDPVALLPDQRPRLLIENASPDRTIAALRDILSDAGFLYDRGVPVRLAFDPTQGGVLVQVVTPDAIVLMTHTVCRPYILKGTPDGPAIEVDARLPRPFATMYLDWRGEWRLRPLNGIASAPLLRDDGSIARGEGYDAVSGMWCENVPDLAGLVPERPTKKDAEAALHQIRDTFKTFCFADAVMIDSAGGGVAVVDTNSAPGRDESAFLVALVTAVCRPSLHPAPGVLLRAAPISGAGAGKGLLARCMSLIAFGREPHAVTAGGSTEELEKRIAAELLEGGPVLFLDNLNNTGLKSDLLASAITERPARVRVLGRSQMLPLNASAFVILTGNGLSVSEDLARRFIAVELDPRCEDPEARPFSSDIRKDVMQRHRELLAAALTIWRWGRITTDIKAGLPLGSFGQWSSWVRDPLLALGCQDPAARVTEAKQRDVRRQTIRELFVIWSDTHHEQPVTASQLHDDVKLALDPQGRGRQFLASQLERLTGVRVAGFILTRQAPVGKWGAATYALNKINSAEEHRDLRDHRAGRIEQENPKGPHAAYAAYANGGDSESADEIAGAVAPVIAVSTEPQPVESGDAQRLVVSKSGWRTRL
jgi:hypothetical protein